MKLYDKGNNNDDENSTIHKRKVVQNVEIQLFWDKSNRKTKEVIFYTKYNRQMKEVIFCTKYSQYTL